MGDGFFERFEPACRLRHPSRVDTEHHLDGRMPELRGDVLRGVAVLDCEPRERVAALVDRSRSYFRARENPRPVARAEVREVERSSRDRREHQLAAHLRSRTLFLERGAYRRDHLDIARGTLRLWQAAPVAATFGKADEYQAVVPVDRVPVKR